MASVIDRAGESGDGTVCGDCLAVDAMDTRSFLLERPVKNGRPGIEGLLSIGFSVSRELKCQCHAT